MKRISKLIGAFAVAGALGFQTLNVSAAETCADNEEVHTNYYMFLDVNTASYYENGIDNVAEGKSFTAWNGAYKYNNIQKAKIIEDGNVAITKGSETTSEGATISWTAAEFWQKWYTASSNMDSNLVYTSGNDSYLFHDKWWSYDENYENGVERSHSNSDRNDALSSYLEGNYSSLATSQLVTNGTSIPTSKVEVPSNLSTSTDTTNLWKISRVFAAKDKLSGVSLNNEKLVYSPAAYYVKYCVTKTDAATKKITYYKNTTDEVTDLPTATTSEVGEEDTISTATPKRDGYKFLGWSSTEGATTAESKYAPGSTYTGSSDLNLYAVWQANDSSSSSSSTPASGTFTISYDANGGNNAPATQTGTVGSCETISKTEPTLTKNKFLGWSTDPEAKEADKNYAPGTDYCDGKNVKLYAVWQTQTGVSAHVVAFVLVALGATAALVAANKKKLFKQI